MSPGWWAPAAGGIDVSLRVTPGARRSEVIACDADRLRIRVQAPAHDGKANAAVQRLVGEVFGVRKSAVSLVRGERSRDKTVRIAGLTEPPASLLDRAARPG